MSELNLTVRVGCSLVYETATPATLLLNLKPRTTLEHVLQQEQFSFGQNLPSEEFVDAHGNILYRVRLQPGSTEIRHDALFSVSSQPENDGLLMAQPIPPDELPPALLRYTMPSRYCDSDKLLDFAWQKFGQVENGLERVQAISDWLHNNIEYRFGSTSRNLSAWDVLQRGHGVCRDFAHMMVALCRTFNIPARYVTGHLPDIGFPDPLGHMDFHAYGEVYLGGKWMTVDARFNKPRVGRIKVSCGLDAVEGAFSTTYGAINLSYFQVWAYQVAQGTVSVGDPIDLSKRLDNTTNIVI